MKKPYDQAAQIVVRTWELQPRKQVFHFLLVLFAPALQNSQGAHTQTLAGANKQQMLEIEARSVWWCSFVTAVGLSKFWIEVVQKRSQIWSDQLPTFPGFSEGGGAWIRIQLLVFAWSLQTRGGVFPQFFGFCCDLCFQLGFIMPTQLSPGRGGK